MAAQEMVTEQSLIQSIPFLTDCSSLIPIHDGYSSDQKYVATQRGKVFLVKTFDVVQLPEKQREYAALEKMAELQVRCSRPVALGQVSEMKLGYMALTFIDGKDGASALPLLSSAEQYSIGTEAGLELKKINTYSAPAEVAPWHERKAAKHHRYLTAYQNGLVKIARDEKIIGFIDDNLHLMNDRPNLFQHDDFHIRNLVVKDGALAGIIDFGRHDWGDPIHEFLKIAHFSSEVSVPFSVGQIRAYCDNRDPDEIFWRLYSLYSAMSFFSFIVWTHHVCPQEMDRTLAILERISGDHDGFERVRPKWYAEYEGI